MLKTNEMTGACVARRRAWGCGALAVALAGSLALAGCTGGTFEEAAEGAGEKSEQGQSGRAQGDSGATGTTDGVDWASLIDIPGMDFEYSDRDKDASYDVASATNIALSGQGATVSGEGAAVEGATVTISAAGTYAVTGELTAGSLVVNAGDQDKVQIVLSGASIRNEAGPALNIQQADKVFVTLDDGTQNTLADGASYELMEGEDEPNAALYSKADLTINGTGALSVEGNYRHGVNSKDDLVVTGGAITVVAKEDGLRGKDCVKVADGSFAITAGGDGVKSSNDEDPTRGFVSIDGGTFAVEAGDEGFQAATYLRLAGGDAQIKAADHALRSDVEAAMTGGTYVVEAGGKGMNPETKFTMDGGTFTVTGCEEGIEAQEGIVNNGELNITASDDGINAAVAERDSNDATISATTDGAGDAAAAEQGFGAGGQNGNADGQNDADGLGMPGGQGGMPEMPEDAEPGQMPGPPEGFDPSSGEVPELPDDVEEGQMPQRPEGEAGERPERGRGGKEADGERPELPEGVEPGQMPDGEQGGGFGARDGRGGAGGPMGANASEDCLIQINGGVVTINAGGDAVDSNGYVEVTGGELVGASSGAGDSALDYEYGATVTGGTVILAGDAGMAETFSEGSTQPFALVSLNGSANTELSVESESGEVLARCTMPVPFQCVTLSVPGLAEGATGKLVAGDAMTDFTASTTPSGGMGAMGAPGGMEAPRDRGDRGGRDAQASTPEATA